jgi:hypothetical protein
MFAGLLDYRYCTVILIAVEFSEGVLDNNLEKGLDISAEWNRTTVPIQNTRTRKYVNEVH